ncbi:hypothetical protein SO802_032494 [Lithocarpus litseifolius]|uniref:Uncharacterized protein n=1 Tax=Lithocarpus litseifolius TaxID=425828 RepID=A0AAW2BDW1_9ROSI
MLKREPVQNQRFVDLSEFKTERTHTTKTILCKEVVVMSTARTSFVPFVFNLHSQFQAR